MNEFISILSEQLSPIFVGGLPGAFGGIAIYIYGHKKGHYRNNKFRAKFFIEVFGASITAYFLTLMIDDGPKKAAIAFVIGMYWSNIIQRARTKITAIVDAALGEVQKGGEK